MTVRQVLKIGDPILNQVAEDIREFDTPYLHQLIQDMRDTMADLNGAGLAAPQIGVSERVVIFAMQDNPRYPDQPVVPETVLINPQIDVLGNQELGMWEGCLSVPGMRGYVERPAKIRYRGFDQFGNTIDRSVDGFHAVVVQHECDHLDGILYPARIRDFSRFGFEQELENRPDYPN
ncbi:MAG: peptide deformylase [Pseudomonadota bacterium]